MPSKTPGRTGITVAQRRRASRDERAAGKTWDSFQNAAANLGVGAGINNQLNGASFGFSPITRVRVQLEWMHRSNALAKLVVNLPADDMTRAGVDFTGIEPDDAAELQRGIVNLAVWQRLADGIRWGALYGGCLVVMLIDGQDYATPLNTDAIRKGDFKGLFVLDRWMVDPTFNRLVSEPGPHLGRPEFYTVTADAPALRGVTIHHSRCVRFDGDRLPRWQEIQENLWSASVLEGVYDLLVMDGSALTGAAQLVYKAFLRVVKIKDLRKLIGVGGGADILYSYVTQMARNQSIEGITTIDAEDDFVPHSVNVNPGISDVIVQISQRLSGGRQIPLVRLLGQSPAGLNSTGESDLRTWYDNVARAQETDLRLPCMTLFRILAKSEGLTIDDEKFNFTFRSLWQMSAPDQAEVAAKDSDRVYKGFESGLLDAATALAELKANGHGAGGRWGTITDEMIATAETEGPPGIDQLGMTGGLENEVGQLEDGPEGESGAAEKEPGSGGGNVTALQRRRAGAE